MDYQFPILFHITYTLQWIRLRRSSLWANDHLLWHKTLSNSITQRLSVQWGIPYNFLVFKIRITTSYLEFHKADYFKLINKTQRVGFWILNLFAITVKEIDQIRLSVLLLKINHNSLWVTLLKDRVTLLMILSLQCIMTWKRNIASVQQSQHKNLINLRNFPYSSCFFIIDENIELF